MGLRLRFSRVASKLPEKISLWALAVAFLELFSQELQQTAAGSSLILRSKTVITRKKHLPD